MTFIPMLASKRKEIRMREKICDRAQRNVRVFDMNDNELSPTTEDRAHLLLTLGKCVPKHLNYGRIGVKLTKPVVERSDNERVKIKPVK